MELLKSLLFMLNAMSPYILLGFLIAGVMHAFVPQRTMARHLAGTGWKASVKAAMIGVPLPLCSCGVLPTAIAMRRGGASKAASTSFLIATPQTGVDSIAATWSLLGPVFAIVRPVAALITSVAGGVAVGRTEKPAGMQCVEDEAEPEKVSFVGKCINALRYGFVDLVGSIGSWLVIGLIVAALITVYVPSDFFSVLGKAPLLSMIAALVIAVPMYVCATGSIPIAMSLMLKGLSPGTAFVLLMAGPAVNFASFTLISREMGRKSAAIYLCSIIAGALTFGLIIDYLMPSQWFTIAMDAHQAHGSHGISWFPLSCSAVLILLLIAVFIRNHKHNRSHITTDSMTKKYQVTGMNCPHCRASVDRSIAAVEGVTTVDVNLSDGIATVEGEHNPDDVIKAVQAAGFEISPL